MRPDPYRLFFPIGVALGLAGVSIWPLYAFGLTASYSGRSHALVQIDGFIYAFVVGFLLTAVPRFTATEVPSRSTQYVLAALLIASAVAAEARAFATATTIFLGAHVMLLSLLAGRVARRQQHPPSTFTLIGLGLLSGLLGASLDAAVAWELIDPFWALLAKRLSSEGMIVLLVLGVGGFLGPRLLGFAALPAFMAHDTRGDRPRSIQSAGRRAIWVLASAGSAILLSVVAEYGFGLPSMAWLRAGVVTALIMTTVQAWRPPAVRSTLAWCVWVSHWLIVTGLWASALAPRYRVDVLHVLFIGGFSLLILAVGTRVTLSHGGHDLGQERRSWPLRIGIALSVTAMLARIGAPFAPNSYFAHLAFAGALWMTGLLFWGVYILRLILRR